MDVKYQQQRDLAAGVTQDDVNYGIARQYIEAEMRAAPFPCNPGKNSAEA
jgi:hypothetical protein